jgi:hypothetical protein
VNRNRPNTLVPDDLLQEKVILCCGEDTGELLNAFNRYRASKIHEYRCYKFWKYDAFTLIWTGIGTGCLEPLLFEVLEPAIIQRIVLIGTAGALNNLRQPGQPHLINDAFLGCTGITLREDRPLHSRWHSDIAALPSASIISTDYYYGFSRMGSPLVKALQEADARLVDVFTKACNQADLVDMETAQFYHLCRVLGGDSLQFVALKGSSNPITDFSLQTLHSQQLLARLCQEAVALLT